LTQNKLSFRNKKARTNSEDCVAPTDHLFCHTIKC
jgi:hypothetical protein